MGSELFFFTKLISTFFYIGYLPFIPGTYGSLAGVFLFWLIKGNPAFCVFLFLLVTIAGFLASGKAEKAFNKKDCRYIVVDEVSGMLLSFTFIPLELEWIIAGFFIFRLLDTLKPFPSGRLQHLRGSAGVMVDDLVAGLYTNIILQAALKLISFKAS